MRAVLAVILAFVVMSVLVLALSLMPWFVVGLDGVLKPGGFDSTAAYDVYAVVAGTSGALFAGWLCAILGRSRTAVVALASVCLALGLVNAVAQHRKAAPGARETGVTVAQAVARRKEPSWFTLLMPVVGSIGVIAGGWRVSRTYRPSDPRNLP